MKRFLTCTVLTVAAWLAGSSMVFAQYGGMGGGGGFGTAAGAQFGGLGNGGGVTTNGAFGQRSLGSTLSPSNNSFSGGRFGAQSNGLQGIGTGGASGFDNLGSVGTSGGLSQQSFVGGA